MSSRNSLELAFEMRVVSKWIQKKYVIHYRWKEFLWLHGTISIGMLKILIIWFICIFSINCNSWCFVIIYSDCIQPTCTKDIYLLIASVNTCVCSNLYCPWSCSFVGFDKWMLIFHKTEFLQRIFGNFFKLNLPSPV